MRKKKRPIRDALFLDDWQVAEILDVSVATVRRWRFFEKGPKYVKIGALCKYRKTDLEQWLAALPSGGEQK